MKCLHVLTGVLVLAGCAAGPDFQAPAPPASTAYAPTPFPAQTATASTLTGSAQRMKAGMAVPSHWWEVFGSAALNRLVDGALRANSDLQAADAALRVAQETALAQRSGYWPSADLHFMPTRQGIAQPVASPAASGSNLYALLTAQLNIAYVPDVFGSNRRAVESLEAQTEVQRMQREAAAVSLSTNVVAAAIQLALLRSQLDITNQAVVAASRMLDISKRQQALGAGSALDVSTQEAALAQARASLPALEKQLAQQRDLLAALTGALPDQVEIESFGLDDLHLPETLPLTLPAQLVDQRPDVRAALAQLRAANANVGAAAAARLPSIMLSATTGSSALELSRLFKAGGGFWSVGADLVQPLFQAGALTHRERAAEAAREQAAAEYRSTVIAACQNVADTLHALYADARALAAGAEAEQAARRNLDMAQRQLELGAVGQPAVLATRQVHLQTLLGIAQARAARLADTAALYQALGGGRLMSAPPINGDDKS
ncbi:efflux transporter outer membrane subunit [Burkholderiaceae bacterium UC74_6]